MSLGIEIPEAFKAIGIGEADIEAVMADAAVKVELLARAHEVADFVRELTPEFDPGKSGRSEPGIGQPGDAKAAIHVVPLVDETWRAREGFRVISQDPKVFWIEFGSRHMPEYAPFQQAITHFHGEGGPGVIPGGVLASHKIMRAQADVRTARFRQAMAIHVGTGARIKSTTADLRRAEYVRSREFKAERQRRYRDAKALRMTKWNP